MSAIARGLLTVAAIVLSAACAGAQNAPALKPQPADSSLILRREADRAYQDKDFTGAAAKLERLVARSPSDGRLWYRYALSLFRINHDSLGLVALHGSYAHGGSVKASNAFDIARVFARRKQVDSTAFWLERALGDGFVDRSKIASDKSFSDLLPPPVLARLTSREGVPSNRVDGWRFDLRFLAQEVERLHPEPRRESPVPAFVAAARALEARLGTLEDGTVVVEIQRLIASLGDGHSSLLPVPTASQSMLALPIELYQFDDGVYIIGGAGEGKSLVGARVVSVGGVPVEQVMQRLTALASGDNMTSKRFFTTQLLPYSLFLQAVGAAEPGKSVALSLVTVDGVSRAAVLALGAPAPNVGLQAPNGVDSATPRYLRAPKRAYWMESITSDSALYVAFQAVRDDPSERLEQFAQRVRDSLHTGRVRNVIVDLRLNRGGDNRLNHPLIRALIAFSDASPDNHLFVIAGRQTLSAGQNFANQLERYARAVFVGEPTGGRPNSSGEDSQIVLPWSGLTVSLSSRWYQDSDPWDVRTTIVPHIPVAVTAVDYFGNRDVAMEVITRIIRARAY